MVVAVERGLESIGDELKKRGFETVDWSSYKNPIDALIYSGILGIPSDVFSFENLDTSSSLNDEREFFMLNVDNMTIDEISQALQSRLYKPLF